MHTNLMRITVGAMLGAVLGACLPSTPEGERDVQCWIDLNESQSSCVQRLLFCIDDTDLEDFEARIECDDKFTNCFDNALFQHRQCEWRTGCLASQFECNKDCGDAANPGIQIECGRICEVEFERCAPWHERDCERKCERNFGECLFEGANSVTEFSRCEEARLECVVGCYDGSPDATSGSGESGGSSGSGGSGGSGGSDGSDGSSESGGSGGPGESGG